MSESGQGTLAGYADDLLEICQTLQLKQAVFVGQSVSAMIGVLAAVQEPALFSRLVLVGPSPRYVDDSADVGGSLRQEIDQLLNLLQTNHVCWAHAMAPTVMGAQALAEPTRALTDRFCRTDSGCCA